MRAPDDHSDRQAETAVESQQDSPGEFASTHQADDSAAITPGPSSQRPTSDIDIKVELRSTARARYRVRGERARGGLGRILDAYDTALGRQVVIKELLIQSPEREARFVREAFLTARLEHPNIVPVYDAGRWRDNGEPYYQMKLVKGQPLSELLAGAATLEARLALLPHALAVVDAIAYAHSEGIIHRDLKPHNVVVGAFGETMVIDWGLAKDVSVDDDRSTTAPIDEYSVAMSAGLTVGGEVFGTPAYMPPEQARGEPVDETADVYALGAIVYNLVAGTPPYSGGHSNDVLESVRRGPPAPLTERMPEAPRELCAIVDRAMSRFPGDRYEDAAELGAELQRFVAGRLVQAYRYSWYDRMRRWLATHRSTVALALSFSIAIGAGALVATNSAMPPPCPDDPTALAGTWDESARADIRGAVGRVYGANAVATHILNAIDDYVGDWRAMRQDSCRATRVLGTQSDAVFEARLRCLERRKRELSGLVSVLRTTDEARVLEKADWAVAELTPIEECADAERLMVRVPPPDDPKRRAAVEALETDLGRLRLSMNAESGGSEYQDAMSLAAGAKERAAELQHPPTTASVQFEYAKLLSKEGKKDEAEAALKEALSNAAAARDDALAARVWIELIRTIGYVQKRPEQATGLEPYARAALVRAGSPPCIEASLVVALGVVDFTYDKAIVSRREALAILERAGQRDSACYARVGVLLGAMLYYKGRYDESIEVYEDVLDFWESRSVGAGTAVAELLNNLGLSLTRQHRFDEALSYHQRALSALEASVGPKNQHVGNSLNHIGNVFVAQGKLDEAETNYRRALGILEATYGPNSSRVASTIMNIGSVAQKRGDFEEAYEAYKKSLELKERADGPKGLLVATSLFYVGSVLTEMGRPEEAVEPLERGLGIAAHHNVEPSWLPEIQFALAKALWQQKRRTASHERRALTLAREARQRYADMGEPAAKEWQEVEDWLARHD